MHQVITNVQDICNGEHEKCEWDEFSSSFWDDEEDIREQFIEEIQGLCNEELEEYKEDDNEYLIKTLWEDEAHISTMVT